MKRLTTDKAEPIRVMTIAKFTTTKAVSNNPFVQLLYYYKFPEMKIFQRREGEGNEKARFFIHSREFNVTAYI